MTKIFLTTEIPQAQTAASKARVDVLKIVTENGYQTVYLPLVMNFRNIVKFWRQLTAIAKPDTHIVIEYPCWMKKRMYLVSLICRLKGIKLYGIIHDIGSLREHLPHGKDLAVLKLFDGLVSHNYMMSQWLREKGYKGKLVPLNVFDYLLTDTPTFANEALTSPAKVFYAGNLDYKKARYVYDTSLNNFRHVELQLYGVNFDATRISHTVVKYMGSFEGSSPSFNTNYHFGLIWEGDSVESCTGPIGDYIRYNNPHKFSLYLALGLPVVVWKEAAIARFVSEHNLGILIEKLTDLDTLIPDLTEEQYQTYVKQVSGFTRKVRSGQFLNTAIEKLLA
jgi:hypothetical protein